MGGDEKSWHFFFSGNLSFFDLLLQKCFLQKNESSDITLKKARAQTKKNVNKS